MDLSYTPEEEAFRAHVRGWIETNAPAAGSLKTLDEMRAWQRKLHAAGFIGTSWPREYGGAGLSPMEQAILNEELARARAPQVVNAMAIWWVGPALMKYGTEEQKKRFIPKILTAEEIWATGYSEPSSGSDMAAAKTRAVRDGDEYVVTGQKIWTTMAHESEWCFLLVRTSREGPKHAGLTILLVDIRTPGVTVRPLRQITGDAEFNELFLDQVRVPVSQRLGAEGQGWAVVMSALVDERSSLATAIRVDEIFARLCETVRAAGLGRDPLWRQRLGALATDCAIVRTSNLRNLSDQLHGRLNPGLASALKLFCSELNQRLSAAGHDALGAGGLLLPGGTDAPERTSWAYKMLYDRCRTIAGGTSEVQRGVIAQRVLGLPRG